MGFGLFLGILLLVCVRRIRINLAGRLVFGEVEFFLDLTLTPGQLLVTLLALEVRADFGFQFLRPLGGVGDVVFKFGRAFLKALDVRFERTNRAQRRVRHARGVAVLSAHNHFHGVVEAGAQEQIEASKSANPHVVAKSVFDFLRAANNQLSGDAPVVERLSIEFNAELVARSILPRGDVLAQVGEASGERLGVLVRAPEVGADAVLLLGVRGA